MYAYPPSIRELGNKHRRKNCKSYIEHPALLEKLKVSRDALVDFNRWRLKFEEYLGDRYLMILPMLEGSFEHAWMDYFGEEARLELEHFSNKGILDMADPIIAVVVINYVVDPFKYESIVLMVNAKTIATYSSGDPVKDWDKMLKRKAEMKPDDTLYHDSCQNFVMDSGFKYAFDLHKRLVKRTINE